MQYQLNGVSPTLPASGDYWLAPNAALIGKVVLGTACSVWFGAVVRGDGEQISIGDGTNIQDLCVLHTDTGFALAIGSNCTVGHRAILHGCSIGNTTLVGMGAVILNGTRIGNHCLIGAGALVTEGRDIPDGVLVLGAPAKVVRRLDADEIAGLARSALSYQQNMRRFADGLSAIPA